MVDQKIEYIKISDLVLWTENPRDSIDDNADNQEIVNKAIKDSYNKWALHKLAKDMGEHYDFSELPTVVYKNKKPIVYDGNRRVVLGKIKFGLVRVPEDFTIDIPYIPSEIPCNVCEEDVALKNIFRKHSDSGSWLPLERDIFVNKFMNKDKSLFLIIEEATGLISGNDALNKRFVKDEVFNKDNLLRIGFNVKDGVLYSKHTADQASLILEDLSNKIINKEISTRKNRGKVVEVLEPSTQKIVNSNSKNTPKLFDLNVNLDGGSVKVAKRRLTSRTNNSGAKIFGKKLFLKSGDVSDLYRDIVDLYEFYINNKKTLSKSFPALIRMSLRLLCETAAIENKLKLDPFLKNNFNLAKSNLDQDQKTTLANQNVTESSIVQLLHTGAHSYTSGQNLEQTLALSFVIGEVLTLIYGKDSV